MFFSKKKKETLTVTGMTCSHCEQSVEKGIKQIAGVDSVKAHANANTVDIFYKGEIPDLVVVKNKIVELGFEIG